ncbi:MAG: hypothetical protein OXH29_12390 [bacterium]|nr:hypothetical protein [bacterium]
MRGRAAAVFVAIAALVVSCGNDSTETVQVLPKEVALPPADAPKPREPVGDTSEPQEPLPDMDAFDEYVRQTPPLPADGGELMECNDIPDMVSYAKGVSRGQLSRPNEVSDVLNTYLLEHPDTYAGRWVHPVYRDVMVMVFTDDPQFHREAIQARLPDRGFVVDVLQAEFSSAELSATQMHFHRQFGDEDGLDGSSTSAKKNRAELYFVDPPEGVLDRLAAMAPTAALCVHVYYPPDPPSGSLDVIPDLDEGDPIVTCRGLPPVPYSTLINPPSIDQFDHPAVDALLAQLDSPMTEPLPQGDWVVIKIDEDEARFAAIDSDQMGTATFKRHIGDSWGLSSWSSGGRCNPVVPLPEGLRRVSVHLYPDALPNPEDTSIKLLVTESDCANGRTMGDALMGPQLVETDEAVLVAFAVVPVYGSATCPGNPSTSVTIELSQPLGQRTLYDGLYVPPKPLTVDEVW